MTENASTEEQSQPSSAPSRRLRSTVNALLAVTFLALTAIAAAGLWQRYEEVLRDGSSNAENMTGILSEHLAIRYDTIGETLRQLAEHNRRIGGPDASGLDWMPFLATAIAGRYALESLIVVDANGTVTYSNHPINMGDSWTDGELYSQLSANPSSDELVTDTPIHSREDGRIVVPVGRVLRTVNSEFQGMLVATLSPEQLREFYRSVDVGANGIISILHPENQILFREPANTKLIGEAWPVIPIGSSGTDGDHHGTVIGKVEASGPDYLTAYRTSEKTGLTIAVSLALDEILAGWWNGLYVALAFVLVVGLILIVVAAIISRALRSRGEPAKATSS